MKSKKHFTTAWVAASGLIAIAGAIVAAELPKDSKNSAAPEFKLPPGWTEADMQLCMAASTPGKLHQYLADGAGVWQGKNTMWMMPGGDPVKGDSTTTITPLMDGRFMKVDLAGDMPGMGPYKRVGIVGYDNVAKQFVSNWIDNFGTGMMNGVGKLSPDGKTLTWSLTFNCPLTQKPAVMRQIETITGPNTKTLEVIGPDPKTGKEYKMTSIAMTRKK